MRKNYQSRQVRASAAADAVVVPDEVTVALGEIAESAKEGLLALAVGAGLQVMAAMMAESVTALCGPKGHHRPERTAVRHGSEAGSVSLGGRRVPVRRPRVRTADGSGELPVAAYEVFTGTEVLGRMAMERMLGGLSARRYTAGLEPVGEAVESAASGTSKSVVSRRFVAATETALADLLGADLSTVDLVAFMVDGVHFGEHCCVVAVGIDIDGTKHPLALVEGSRGERDPGDGPACRPARTRPGRDPPGAGGAGRVEGAAPRCARRVRPAGDRPLSTPLCRPPGYADVEPVSPCGAGVSGWPGRHNPVS